MKINFELHCKFRYRLNTIFTIISNSSLFLMLMSFSIVNQNEIEIVDAAQYNYKKMIRVF